MSFVKYTKPKTVEQVHNLVTSRIESLERRLYCYRFLVTAFAPFVGKKITVRMTKHAMSLLPNARIYLEHSVGMIYVKMLLPNNKYENVESFLLRYTSDSDLYYAEKFAQHNGNCETIKPAIDQYKAGLVYLSHFVERYNTLLQTAIQLENDASMYGLEYEFDLVHQGGLR